MPHHRNRSECSFTSYAVIKLDLVTAECSRKYPSFDSFLTSPILHFRQCPYQSFMVTVFIHVCGTALFIAAQCPLTETVLTLGILKKTHQRRSLVHIPFGLHHAVHSRSWYSFSAHHHKHSQSRHEDAHGFLFLLWSQGCGSVWLLHSREQKMRGLHFLYMLNPRR